MTFFIGTWEEHVTGVLRTHVNNIGVTEVQFFSMVICLCPIIESLATFLSTEIISDFTLTDILVYLNCLL